MESFFGDKDKIVKKIAIVFTCHNRINSTKRVVKSVFEQYSIKQYDIRLFVCDDGCDDGTSEFLDTYEKISIVRGNGDLYWTRGMACALELAEAWDPDYYLMINDDVVFFPNMLDIIISSYHQRQHSAIAGALKDEYSGECSYSGINKLHGKTYRVIPSIDMEECQFANWNCFFLPSDIYNQVGKLDVQYEHSYGDYDYSFRIRKSGFNIYVSREYVGICPRNSIKGTSSDSCLDFATRIKRLHRRKESPIKSRWHFFWKINRWTCIIHFCAPYFRIFVDSFKKEIENDKI